MDSLDRLLRAGLTKVGKWELDGDGRLALLLDDKAAASPVLYAFVQDASVRYVGKSSQALANRLYGYTRPGPSQKTNIRLNRLLIDELTRGGAVDIYALEDTAPTEHAGFSINLPAALEDDIIRQLQPDWNSNGVATPASTAKSAEFEKPTPAKPAADAESRLKPSFSVQIGKTYRRQGFFNVPVDYARYFGRHGQEIEIRVSGGRSAWGTINRKVNSNDTPRIMGGTALRDWFVDNLKLGDRAKVVVLSPQSITLERA